MNIIRDQVFAPVSILSSHRKYTECTMCASPPDFGSANSKHPVRCVVHMIPGDVRIPNKDRPITPEYLQEAGYDDDTEFSRHMFERHNILCATVTSQAAKSDMIFCHGNGQDLIHTLSNDLSVSSTKNILEKVSKAMECNITMVEYPGYDSLEHVPTEEGCMQAAEKVIMAKIHAMERTGRPIVICGYSLGSAIATKCAARISKNNSLRAYMHQIHLLLLAPLESAISTVMPRWLTNTLLWPFDMFRTDDAQDITMPVYIIHGTHDVVVPSSNTSNILSKLSSSRSKKAKYLQGVNHELFTPAHIEVLLAELATYANAITGTHTGVSITL